MNAYAERFVRTASAPNAPTGCRSSANGICTRLCRSTQACPKASGTGSSCGSAPPCPPRPRWRAGSSADGRRTATGSPTPGRTPNPAKAADGKRLHKLEPDPATAWVIRRIFAEYLAGRGLFAIAEGLTRDGIPTRPGATSTNQHRTGQGWSKSAVRTILAHPHYTRQHVDEQRQGRDPPKRQRRGRGLCDRMSWNGRPLGLVRCHRPRPLITGEDSQAGPAIIAVPADHPQRPRTHQHVIPLRPRAAVTTVLRPPNPRGQYSNQAPYYHAATPANMPWPATSAPLRNVYLAKPTCCPPVSTVAGRRSSRRAARSRPSARCNRPNASLPSQPCQRQMRRPSS